MKALLREDLWWAFIVAHAVRSPEGWLITQLEIYDQDTIISRSEFILVIHILFIYVLCYCLWNWLLPPLVVEKTVETDMPVHSERKKVKRNVI